jgi:hypothetical protein
MYALWAGSDHKIVKALLDKRANPLLYNNSGDCPLSLLRSLAQWSGSKDEKASLLLLEAAAAAAAKDGLSPSWAMAGREGGRVPVSAAEEAAAAAAAAAAGGGGGGGGKEKEEGEGGGEEGKEGGREGGREGGVSPAPVGGGGGGGGGKKKNRKKKKKGGAGGAETKEEGEGEDEEEDEEDEEEDEEGKMWHFVLTPRPLLTKEVKAAVEGGMELGLSFSELANRRLFFACLWRMKEREGGREEGEEEEGGGKGGRRRARERRKGWRWTREEESLIGNFAACVPVWEGLA